MKKLILLLFIFISSYSFADLYVVGSPTQPDWSITSNTQLGACIAHVKKNYPNVVADGQLDRTNVQGNGCYGGYNYQQYFGVINIVTASTPTPEPTTTPKPTPKCNQNSGDTIEFWMPYPKTCARFDIRDDQGRIKPLDINSCKSYGQSVRTFCQDSCNWNYVDGSGTSLNTQNINGDGQTAYAKGTYKTDGSTCQTPTYTSDLKPTKPSQVQGTPAQATFDNPKSQWDCDQRGDGSVYGKFNDKGGCFKQNTGPTPNPNSTPTPTTVGQTPPPAPSLPPGEIKPDGQGGFTVKFPEGIATEATQAQIAKASNETASATKSIASSTKTLLERIEDFFKGDLPDAGLKESTDELKQVQQETKTSIESLGKANNHGVDLEIKPNMPSAGACRQYQYGAGGHFITFDPCEEVNKIRDLLGYIIYIATFFMLFKILTTKGA